MLANFTKETKQLLQDVIKNQENVQKNIDMGFTRLHEQMVNEFYKNIDHQSFINVVDKKFDHLNDVFTKCIDSKDDIKNPNVFNQEIGENDIKQEVCLMGSTVSVR